MGRILVINNIFRYVENFANFDFFKILEFWQVWENFANFDFF